jgi:hypothetical protein
MYSSKTFLTSATDGGEWSSSHPSHFILNEIAPTTHWVGPRTGLDTVSSRKIPSPFWKSNPDHLSSSPQPVAIPIELSPKLTSQNRGEINSKTKKYQWFVCNAFFYKHKIPFWITHSVSEPKHGPQFVNQNSVSHDVNTYMNKVTYGFHSLSKAKSTSITKFVKCDLWQKLPNWASAYKAHDRHTRIP